MFSLTNCLLAGLGFILLEVLVIYIVDRLELPKLARHEAGHALIAWILPLAKKVDYATCGRFWSFGGKASWKPLNTQIIHESDLVTSIAISLAGEAAEEVADPKSWRTGSRSDRKRAAKCAEIIVRSRCRHKKIELPPKDHKWKRIPISANALKIIDDCWEWDLEALNQHREPLDRLTKDLIKKRYLDTKGLEKILGPKVRFEKTT